MAFPTAQALWPKQQLSATMDDRLRPETNSHTKTRVDAITCFVRPPMLFDITAKFNTATAPKPCVQLKHKRRSSEK